MTEVIVVIGAGSIGQAIVRRVSAGKHVLLADIKQENAEAAARILFDAGFDVSTVTVDVSARASVHALVQAATKIEKSLVSFMPRVYRHLKRRQRRF